TLRTSDTVMTTATTQGPATIGAGYDEPSSDHRTRSKLAVNWLALNVDNNRNLRKSRINGYGRV
uniref:hypothetical protein n=1 Tax=Microbacterium sp. PF5 TaxID=2305435 RepID=UPI00197B4FFB